MKIVVEDSLVARLKPEYAERHVLLTPTEKAVLYSAKLICQKAGELQAAINRAERIPDDYNDFEWARIYLADCVS